jgi:CHASE2 domain-containing sensor protein
MEPLSATFITWAIYLAPLAGTAIATGFLSKTGENLSDSLLATLQRKFPTSPTLKLLTAGKAPEFEQAVLDLEPVLADPEVRELLTEMRALMSSNQELAQKLAVTEKQIRNIQVNKDQSQGYQFNEKVEAQNIGGNHTHHHYHGDTNKQH